MTPVNQEVPMLLDRTSADFHKEMWRHIRAQKQVQKATADVDFLNDERNGQQYPSGMRPMRTNVSQNEMDEKFSMTIGGDFTLNVTIPKGATRREDVVAAHRQMMTFSRKVDIEAMKDHLGATKFRASKSTSKQANEDILEEHRFEWKHIQDLEVDIEGLVEANSQVPQGWVGDYIDRKYRDNFKQVEEALEKRGRRAEKLKEEQAKKAEEQLLQKDPAVALTELMDDRIKKYNEKKGDKRDALRGANRADVGWLLKMKQLYSKVLIYSHADRIVSAAGFSTLPWPIAYLLGRYHTKHIFTTRKAPSIEDIHEHITDGIHKISGCMHALHQKQVGLSMAAAPTAPIAVTAASELRRCKCRTSHAHICLSQNVKRGWASTRSASLMRRMRASATDRRTESAPLPTRSRSCAFRSGFATVGLGHPI